MGHERCLRLVHGGALPWHNLRLSTSAPTTRPIIHEGRASALPSKEITPQQKNEPSQSFAKAYKQQQQQ
jgi:hypothetical protein